MEEGGGGNREHDEKKKSKVKLNNLNYVLMSIFLLIPKGRNKECVKEG